MTRKDCNWAVERLLADPTLTRYDLQNEFTKLRQVTPHLQHIERIYQNTAIHQARTAADLSNKYGKHALRFRSKKRDGTKAVSCDVPPKFVNNQTMSLPGLGHVRLCKEQPYKYPHNWLYGARSYRLVDITPKSWTHTKPHDRIYRLYVSYKMADPEPRHTGVAAGIDRGVTNPTVVCKTDGTTKDVACYDTAVSFRKNQTWNDNVRHTISHRNKHSNTTQKIKRQRSNYNRHNANARDYSEWLLAREICHDVDTICIEDLNIEAMTRKGNAAKRGLNRGLRYIRHHFILRKVRVVAERLGIRIIEVNPKHTSQECYVCGCVYKTNRHKERFLCVSCGRADHADSNASANIIQRGTRIKVPAGGGITLERREMGRARKPPKLVCTVPDAMRRRDNQARNRPETSSAKKHLERYVYITR